MKVKFFHDGSGNFTGGVTEGMDGTDENQIAGMKPVLTSVAQGFGQAFVFAAGRRGMPVGKCVVTVEGEADMDAFHRDGIDLTVEVQGPRDTMEKLVSEALSHCLPAGTLVCPLRHTVIEIPRS